MISIERSLQHMAWSNAAIFDELSKLPNEIYGLRAAEGEWPVGKILNHFIGAAEWFCYLLNGRPWTDQPKITSSEILTQMRSYLSELDQIILAESTKPDAEITFRGDNGEEERTTRGMVLAQAVTHTAEHKGQLATLLKANGFELNLDKFDLWNFDSKNR